MRYWKPIHHLRWQSFLEVLSGETATTRPAAEDLPLELAPGSTSEPAAPAAESESRPSAVAPASPEPDITIEPKEETLSEIKVEAEVEVEPEVRAEPEPESEKELKPEAAAEAAVAPETETDAEAAVETPSAPAGKATALELSKSKEALKQNDRDEPPASLPSAGEIKSPIPTPNALDPRRITASAFFAALGWQTGRPRVQPSAPQDAPSNSPQSEQDAMPTGKAAAYQGKDPTGSPGRSAPYAETALLAGPFFKTIPWDGRYAPGEPLHSFSVQAVQEDMQLDPRTAEVPGANPLLAGMRSAAKTSDRLAAAQAERGLALAGNYFRDLPWSHH